MIYSYDAYLVDVGLLIIRCLNVLGSINHEEVRKSLSVNDLTKLVETAQKLAAENASEIMVCMVCDLLMKVSHWMTV